jgi:ribonuclease-3
VLRDFKTNLQELAAQSSGAVPEYRISSSGPDHDKRFEAEVYVQGRLLGAGVGRSKKLAEQAAAEQALSQVQDLTADARAT